MIQLEDDVAYPDPRPIAKALAEIKAPVDFAKDMHSSVAMVAKQSEIEEDETLETLASLRAAERLTGSTMKVPSMAGRMLAITGFEEDSRINGQMLSTGMVDKETENKIADERE